MEEIMSEIIAKEKEAEELVTKAKEKALEISREGDIQAAKLTEDAKKKGTEIYSRLVGDAEEKAKQNFDAGIEEIKNMKTELFRTKSGELEQLIDEITGLVISSDLNL